jgi:hypothetical protein
VEASLLHAYNVLTRRDEHPFELVWVSQDASASEYDAGRARMPWPALPHGSLAAAALADRFHIESVPSLVLLAADGRLISSDGLRLMRHHTSAFPWAARPPPQVPHHHRHFERLVRHAVHEGSRTRPLEPLPIDMLAQPERMVDFANALSAVRHCDKLCTLISVQCQTLKPPIHFKIALLEHTFTQLLPLPLPQNHPSVRTCIWRKQIKCARSSTRPASPRA